MIRKKKERRPEMAEEKKSTEGKPKIYSIVSVPEFFRRSGMLFTKAPILLIEDKMTPEIFAEKMLVITEVKDTSEKKEKIK